MLEFIKNYSGIFAIIVYGIIILVVLKFRKKEKTETEQPYQAEREFSPLDVNDEDATVACLVAAIDLREQTGKNVQVLSVREVK